MSVILGSEIARLVFGRLCIIYADCFSLFCSSPVQSYYFIRMLCILFENCVVGVTYTAGCDVHDVM